MTESEAKRKKCCGSEGCGTRHPQGTVEQTGAADPNDRWCIGSACMAWRWDWVLDEHGEHSLSKATGFCGIAGKP